MCVCKKKKKGAGRRWCFEFDMLRVCVCVCVCVFPFPPSALRAAFPGVVDCDDLPLNVSREILQESKIVRIIRKRLLSKSLDMLKEVQARDSPDDYENLWKAFGRNLKLGIIEDQENREVGWDASDGAGKSAARRCHALRLP